jgi:hypothetical protein
MVFASPTMMAKALARAAAVSSHDGSSSQARIGSGSSTEFCLCISFQ